MLKDVSVDITIDVVSKLKKIYEGKTFSDSLVIITELFQNSQRAKAKDVDIYLNENSLTFKDNGCGCKKVGNILRLDYSEWESTEEGFGIGLWSWLAVNNVSGIEIRSCNWQANLTTKEIFENNNLGVNINFMPEEENVKGFEVTIFSDIFTNCIEEVKERIISDGEMQLCNVYLNGDLIPKKDLHAEVNNMEYAKSFSNKYFEATFAPSSWGKIDSYYERRIIDNFYPVDYLTGVIEVKKNALTLQEPDRKNVIRDNKRYDFIKKVEECRKELYLDIVKKCDSKAIDEYSYQIDKVLKVEDYEKYLLVDDLVLEVEEESRNIEKINPVSKINSFKRLVEVIENMNTNTQLSLTNNQELSDQEIVEELLNVNSDYFKWIKANNEEIGYACPIENIYSLDKPINDEMFQDIDYLSVGGGVYKKVNISEFKEMFKDDNEEITSSIIVKTAKERKKKDSLRSVLKKSNRKVWVKASEVEEYADIIAKVEYYGVKVFIAKNILHENVFRENKISYVTDIESGIQKTNIKWNVELRTKKEERFIELLQHITNYYYLPINTFKVGNLKLMIETVLDNKVINREIVENRKDSINIYGVTDGRDIILDRRALGLQRFNISGNNIGVNEFKALMANMKTISHELAHLLYGTEDNTKEHIAREDRIYEEIVNIYLTI